MEDGSNTMKGGSGKAMGHKRKKEREREREREREKKKTKYVPLIVIG